MRDTATTATSNRRCFSGGSRTPPWGKYPRARTGTLRDTSRGSANSRRIARICSTTSCRPGDLAFSGGTIRLPLAGPSLDLSVVGGTGVLDSRSILSFFNMRMLCHCIWISLMLFDTVGISQRIQRMLAITVSWAYTGDHTSASKVSHEGVFQHLSQFAAPERRVYLLRAYTQPLLL